MPEGIHSEKKKRVGGTPQDKGSGRHAFTEGKATGYGGKETNLHRG